MSALREPLRGVLGFPFTPFHEDLSLDLAALEQSVDRMASHPFCAIVATGGAGEIYSLAPEEAVAVVEVTVKAVNGRMPVIAGVGLNAAAATRMARGMERAGADGILILPPYYTNAPEGGLFDYYAAVASSTGLPSGIYTRDWAALTPGQGRRLLEFVPSIAFWKDGQGDMRRFRRIMAECREGIGWIGGAGDDAIPAYTAIGVRAFTSSVSAIAPKLSLAAGEAALAGDYGRLDEIERRYIHPLFAIRDRMRGYEVAAMKKASALLGFPVGPVRPPLPAVRPEDARDLAALMESYREFL